MMRNSFLVLLFLSIIACNSEPASTEQEDMTIISDPHSFSRPSEAVVKHLNLNIAVRFNLKQIIGTATYIFDAQDSAKQIIFDTDGLIIEDVTMDGKTVPYELGEPVEHLGQPLIVTLEGKTPQVTIRYKSSPQAEALQWLDPRQTAGKEHPFLFTQSQAILARTWIPCQDSPGIRFTYNANVEVPAELMAVMSAENPVEKSADGIYHFEMNQPIPSYLMALAVGDLVFQPVGEHTGVYAEAEMIEKAVYEFAEMENMLQAAEKLYGKYAWERYDVLVLPPSFPFGGMENPRLTFATPTILAGDRSLTALVAHELAHSWSGNLVTNATWNDFWLNEGFTVYFEQRIMEALYGREYSEMLATLSYEGLLEEIGDISKERPEDTHLKLDLEGRNPDDGMTAIAYDKGYFFLRLLEETVGREKFDRFLKSYFQKNAFKVMDTETFTEALKKDLLDSAQLKTVRLDEWIYGPGLPDNVPQTNPVRFQKVDLAVDAWKEGKKAGELETSEWSTHEWLYFLRSLPKEISNERLAELDKAFGFTSSGNREIQAAWFQHTIRNDYHQADKALEEFLVTVGRRKFLTPTYKALIEADTTKARARAIYAKARPNYHAVSYQTIDELLEVHEEN